MRRAGVVELGHLALVHAHDAVVRNETLADAFTAQRFEITGDVADARITNITVLNVDQRRRHGGAAGAAHSHMRLLQKMRAAAEGMTIEYGGRPVRRLRRFGPVAEAVGHHRRETTALLGDTPAVARLRARHHRPAGRTPLKRARRRRLAGNQARKHYRALRGMGIDIELGRQALHGAETGAGRAAAGKSVAQAFGLVAHAGAAINGRRLHCAPSFGTIGADDNLALPRMSDDVGAKLAGYDGRPARGGLVETRPA